jgi:hypothetical protein
MHNELLHILVDKGIALGLELILEISSCFSFKFFLYSFLESKLFLRR